MTERVVAPNYKAFNFESAHRAANTWAATATRQHSKSPPVCASKPESNDSISKETKSGDAEAEPAINRTSSTAAATPSLTARMTSLSRKPNSFPKQRIEHTR